jgi:hypothetical protein
VSFGDFMGLFMVVIGMISIAAIIGEAYKQRLKFRLREMEMRAGQLQARPVQDALLEERLEARLRVLERIATDRGANLAAAIEELRDPVAN